jgi:hypothetical protein
VTNRASYRNCNKVRRANLWIWTLKIWRKLKLTKQGITQIDLGSLSPISNRSTILEWINPGDKPPITTIQLPNLRSQKEARKPLILILRSPLSHSSTKLKIMRTLKRILKSSLCNKNTMMLSKKMSITFLMTVTNK